MLEIKLFSSYEHWRV